VSGEDYTLEQQVHLYAQGWKLGASGRGAESDHWPREFLAGFVDGYSQTKKYERRAARLFAEERNRRQKS
jgi:hypothetical protein